MQYIVWNSWDSYLMTYGMRNVLLGMDVQKPKSKVQQMRPGLKSYTLYHTQLDWCQPCQSCTTTTSPWTCTTIVTLLSLSNCSVSSLAKMHAACSCSLHNVLHTLSCNRLWFQLNFLLTVECTSDDDCVLVEVEGHEKTCQGYFIASFLLFMWWAW